MTKVFIKPIPRDTASKVSEFKNDTSKIKMNKTKIGRNTYDGLQALYNSGTGRLSTGLDEYVENPYNNEDSNYPPEFEKVVKGKDKILRQHLLEIKHQKPINFYSPMAPRKEDHKVPEHKMPFFHTFSFKLKDGATVLDLNKPDDEIAYYIALASSKIANSWKDYANYKFPRATHFISLEGEDESLKFERSKQIDKAKGFLTSEDLTEEWVIKFAKYLELSKGTVTYKVAYNLLSEFIEKSKTGKKDSVEKFIFLYKEFQTAPGKEKITAAALLEDLIYYRIIGVRQGTYTWFNKNMVIGNRREEAIDFLIDPNKQPEQEELTNELKIKMKF